MSNTTGNTKILMDIESKRTFVVSMDGTGKVLDIAPLKDTPPFAVARPGMPPAQPKPLAGTKSFCVDMSAAEAKPQIYTIAWPSKQDVEKAQNEGKPDPLPHVAKKELPQDLIKAGLAAMPDSLKTDEEREETNDAEIAAAMENINKLIGLGEVKDKLQSQIKKTKYVLARRKILKKSKKFKLPEKEKSSLHMVFSGNPGTGKTTVAREYGKMLKALGLVSKGHIVEAQAADLIAGYVGQTGPQTRAKIEEALGGVLFIDEAYGITEGVNGEKFGKEAIAELVAAMENHRDDLVIIVAGYPDLMKNFINSNPGLKRRFVNYLNFADYEGQELADIMDLMSEEHAVVLTPEAKALAVQKIEREKKKSGKNFGNAGTVRNVIELAIENMAARVMEVNSVGDFNKMAQKDAEEMLTTITAEDIKKINLDGIKNVKKSKGVGFSIPEEQKAGGPKKLAAHFEPVSDSRQDASNDDAARPAVRPSAPGR